MSALRPVICLAALLIAAPSFAAPVGLWQADDGGMIRVAPCGKALCGTVVKTVPATDPETGKPATDKNNPDPAKRHRPIVGIHVLIGMKPSDPGKWSGTLYNDDDGKTYVGNLIEIDGNSIRIEGCAGVCGGQVLKRAK
ncbi:MAG: DUF2147 domain-containing protein [Pseudolabrys sp.]|nr:DUF2147 domain-containing protein [Pseudolabrys sp.]MBV9259951.1 DUF2147 domain-containing protein [Pseudolabrys sp.]